MSDAHTSAGVNADCFICLKKIEYAAQLLAANCGHTFHQICFNTRVKNQKNFPVCKADLSSRSESEANSRPTSALGRAEDDSINEPEGNSGKDDNIMEDLQQAIRDCNKRSEALADNNTNLQKMLQVLENQ